MNLRTSISASLLALIFASCGGGSSSPPHSASSASPDTGTNGSPPPATSTADPLEEALKTGDTSHVTDQATYLDAILETISDGRSKYNTAKTELFQLSPDGSLKSDSLTQLSWDPTHDSGKILPVFPYSSTVIQTNKARENHTLAIQPMAAIGENEHTRFMAFGTNPFRHPDSLSPDMHKFLANSLSWLTKMDFGTASPKVVIAQVDESYYFRDETRTREWLSTRYGDGAVSVNDVDVCDGDALQSCLADADLLIISDRHETEEEAVRIRNTVEQAMSNGVPVLYIHRSWGFGTLSGEMLNLLKMRWGGHNYWSRSLVENYNPAELFNALPEDIGATQTMFTHFKNESFTVDLTQCSNHDCPQDSPFAKEFSNGSSSVRNIISGMEKQKLDLFELPENRLEKLFVLLADRWRQEAVFPMDKTKTDKTMFLKSLYADYVNYIHRPHNPVQKDLGNYSRSDFSHITPESRTVNMKAQKNYRSSSTYAIPGQTFKVTRLDTADISTSIQINSVRTGAVHLYDEDGYVRPRFSGASTRLPIASGETLELTSSYGGPIHIYFGGEGADVSFEFENIGSHPYWNGPEDDSTFNTAMIAKDYDWAEFATPHFEITSKTDKFEQTMAHDRVNGDTQSLAAQISKYHHDIPRALGGYTGDGITLNNEVTDFAQAHGLELYQWNGVQHMNADQATCGSGCSGNPYDAWWSFGPLDHGDLHEVGHGLETRRMLFSEWSGHAATNWYSYYPKYRFYKDTGQDSGCQSLPYETLFHDLQASRKQTDPIAYMDARDYNGWSNGAAIMIQMLAATEHENILSDGWMLLPRLHLITRAFQAADNNDETWIEGRDKIGFDSMTRAAALALTDEEWLMIAASHATSRNMSNYFEMWGAILSPAAKDHVSALSLPQMPTQFYAMGEKDHCYAKLGDSIAVPVDGSATWPIQKTSSNQKFEPHQNHEHPDHGKYEAEVMDHGNQARHTPH